MNNKQATNCSAAVLWPTNHEWMLVAARGYLPPGANVCIAVDIQFTKRINGVNWWTIWTTDEVN